MNPSPTPQKTSRSTYATDAAKWRAVAAKDRCADGVFYFSVKTTGVYCLPSCPARTALRKNVAFHASAAEAERAGFRACKRCWPRGPRLAETHAAAVAKACRLIETAETEPMLDALAKTAGMSRHHFHRVFRQLTGVTPKDYAAAHRARRVREGLARGGTVTGAIYAAGFGSNGRFYAQATATLGMTPRAFRNGGPGATIRFALGECSLGSVLVAASEKGVCAITLGDDPEALVRDLQDRFPKAELLGGDRKFERMIAHVIAFIEAPQTGLDLPLDIRGTVFQQKVWRALQAIPAGATTSYAALAQKIGAPRAVRAVAGACAANSLAVAIPCHRVVRHDGALAGYRWGIDRKRVLLRREREGMTNDE